MSDSVSVILLVEDDDDTREAFRELLEMHGWNVAEARDGQEALRQVKRLVPCLVLLDVTLPFLSGIDVAARLQAAPITALVPLVAMTGHSLTSNESQLFAGVLTKPVDFDELLALIGRLIPLVAT